MPPSHEVCLVVLTGANCAEYRSPPCRSKGQDSGVVEHALLFQSPQQQARTPVIDLLQHGRIICGCRRYMFSLVTAGKRPAGAADSAGMKRPSKGHIQKEGSRTRACDKNSTPAGCRKSAKIASDFHRTVSPSPPSSIGGLANKLIR